MHTNQSNSITFGIKMLIHLGATSQGGWIWSTGGGLRGPGGSDGSLEPQMLTNPSNMITFGTKMLIHGGGYFPGGSRMLGILWRPVAGCGILWHPVATESCPYYITLLEESKPGSFNLTGMA